MRPSLLLRSTRPWLAAGTITLALMLTACGGDNSPGASGGTIQPTAANGNKPDKSGSCSTRCAP